MVTATHCPNPDCAVKFRVAEEHVGKIGRRTSCGTWLRISAGFSVLVELGSSAVHTVVPATAQIVTEHSGGLKTFEGHTNAVSSVAISPNGRWCLSGSFDNTLRLWELDWDYEFPGWANWNDGARPYLVNFLTMQTPYAGTLPTDRDPTPDEIATALTRRGKSTWTDEDFQQLLYTLGCVGYGWLRPEGVKGELGEMAADWQGPPPLMGT